MNRILVVDDKEENLRYLEALLTGHNYAVETARHGAEALLKARKNPPDLIISDLLIPKDGYTLLRQWKADAALNRVPFIVCSETHTRAEDERLALNLGADAFILKPAEPEIFIKRIREFILPDPIGRLPSQPADDDPASMKVYSQTLIRKLEEKTFALEAANRELLADIATRRRTEASLRESEQRFLQMAENIQEVFWLTSPDSNEIIYVSPAYEKIWGRTCAELYANPDSWADALHPDDQARIVDAMVQKKSCGDYDEIYRIVRPDGAVRWIHDRSLPIRDPQGKPHRVVGTSTDITERRLAEERIREQAALLDQSHDAIIVSDLDQHVRYWSKGAEKMYGWTAAEAVGRPIGQLIYRSIDHLAAAHALLLREGSWSGELEHLTKARSPITTECSCTLLRDETGAPKSVLAVNTDVTNRKKIEAQFLRAQRLESIGNLAGGISHDLNNLLSPIIMGVELLKQQNHDENSRRIIKIIDRSARRGTDLVKQVLSLARGIEGARVAVHLGHIAREIENIAKTTFPKNITFIRDVPKDLWLVAGDPTQLNQAILNLCVNARDALPDGGNLCVSARNVEIDAHYTAMNPAVPPGRYIVLEVADNGTGTPKAVIDRVFEPFFTTKDPSKGTGQGLSTVMGIVRSHGGVAGVASEPGKGSVFKIHLPAMPDEESAGLAVPIDQPTPHGHAQLILVVDDEAAIIDITRQTLETFGYRVVTAANGAEAMAIFAMQNREIDLVLTDIMMPIMDGLALIPALRRLKPDVRVIATSGINASGDEARALKAGAQRFIGKPYTADRLLHLIDQVLARADADP